MTFDLSRWLRKTPQPSAILADDKRIEVPRGGRGWRDLTKTIEALEASKIVALNGQGEVIRSTRLDSETDEEKTSAPAAEMSDVQLFARLISEAYERGATTYAPLLTSAMSFVETQGLRLHKAEQEIDRLRTVVHKLNLQIIELTAIEAPSGEDGIMGALVAGIAQGQAAALPAPGNNGKQQARPKEST